MNMSHLFPVALLAAVAAFQPAAAAPPEERPFPTALVSYADLDLTTRTGLARFDRRLTEAVREVCGSFGRYSAGEENAARRCRVSTLANLRAQRAQALAAQSEVQVAGRDR